MLRNEKILILKNNYQLFWLTAGLLLIGLLAACGSQAQEVAMSEPPPRRGAVDTLVEVQDIAAEVLGISADELLEGVDLREDLNVTDEQMQELADALNEAFSIEITDEEIDNLTTIQSVVELIDAKQ